MSPELALHMTPRLLYASCMSCTSHVHLTPLSNVASSLNPDPLGHPLARLNASGGFSLKAVKNALVLQIRREETFLPISILPIPDLPQEMFHVNVPTMHLDHPWMFQHAPGCGSSGGFFLKAFFNRYKSAYCLFSWDHLTKRNI